MASAPAFVAPRRVTTLTAPEAQALVRMWRDSFEHGVGIRDPHPLHEQIDFLLTKVMPAHVVRVVEEEGRPVGFIASTPESVSQLYVRVDRIGLGIGSTLLALAQAESAGHLWLYTFARNLRARAFYERHGFVDVGHGFEPNWQLEDVRFEWRRGGARPG